MYSTHATCAHVLPLASSATRFTAPPGTSHSAHTGAVPAARPSSAHASQRHSPAGIAATP